MEKGNPKNKIINPGKTKISQFRNSVSYSALSNHQFIYFANNLNNNSDKSSSTSSIKSDVDSQTKSNYTFVSDPISEIKKVNNVIIKVEYQNCCCINESNTIYNVFTKNKTNIKYLFRAEELIPCSDYSCFEYFEKSYILNIEHVLNVNPIITSKKFATATESCNFPCFCLCRPEMKVKILRSKGICGKIVLLYSCGKTMYQIYDSRQRLKYTLDTNYCQPGIICTKNCCGYLPDVIFDILNEKKISIGTIERKPGAFGEFMKVLDCYQIFFPTNSTFEDKFLLICATFLIEMKIFRDKWGRLEYCSDDTCSCRCNCDCGCKCDGECCANCLYQCCSQCCQGFFRC